MLSVCAPRACTHARTETLVVRERGVTQSLSLTVQDSGTCLSSTYVFTKVWSARGTSTVECLSLEHSRAAPRTACMMAETNASFSWRAHGVFLSGVRDAFVLWHHVDDATGADELFETRAATVSMAGGWSLFVEPAVRRTQQVPPDAVEPLGVVCVCVCVCVCVLTEKEMTNDLRLRIF